MKELEGRVAVITGGASGIGLGLAHRFAAEGMKLVIGDVETAALDDAVATLRGKGAEVLGVVTDVADPDQVQALADAAVSRFGGVHVCCNNAGVGTGGLSWEIPRATWEWVLGVNLWGVIHGIRTFVPLLVQQPEAHVVNTASIAGLVAAPFMGPYNASKHAVVAISETLHHELAMHAPHVKVSVVCPGWVRTKIADSERNRPPHLRVDDTAATLEAAGAEMLRGFLEQGMSPDLVAGKVVTALREDRFWVLTHDDESDFWVGSVQRRLHSLERRANPELSLPF